MSERLRFTAADGVTYRVHDVAFGPPHARPFQRRRLEPADPRANYRWFVTADGVQRLH